MDRTEHRFSPSGRLPGGDFRVRRQSCQQDGAEQQRERAAPPGHVCASAHGGVSGVQSRFAGADCPAGQLCRPADRRARCPADRRAPCRADFRVESVHVSPPFRCGSVCAAALFHAGGGIVPCGGVPPTLPADRAVPEAARGACLFSRLPALPLAFFTAPLPRRGRIDPRPRSQSALPLRGRGRLRFFHARGFAPFIPGAESGRHLQPQQKRYPAGGLPCLPPACPAFSLFSFPHPPSPLPLRGRGRP